MRRVYILQLAIVMSVAAVAMARTPEPRPPVRASGPQSSQSSFQFTSLADYDFESPPGQGWTTRDLTEQPGTYFHVDDFADLSEFAPIGGSQSLWCGTRATGETCRYVNAGYGNEWRQYFEATDIIGSGPMALQFDVRYDTEPPFDVFSVDVWSGSDWTELANYSGADSTTLTFPSVFSSSGRIRFRFESDGSYSDEDGGFPTRGAVIIDNIVVSDSTGVVYSQDFESESFGSLITNDGVWQATTPRGFGNFTNLFTGGTVFQQTSPNLSQLWGFVDGSPADYACGGYPGVPAVPFRTGNNIDSSFANAIESPTIIIPPGSDATLRLSFDIYADLPLDNLVFYQPAAQFEVGGCWQAWQLSPPFFSPSIEWLRQASEFAIPPGATSVRVAIRTVDLCWVFCGQVGTGNCHSNGPLIDNVNVAVVSEPSIVVTNTNDSGPGSLRSAIEQANASPTLDVITFELAGGGPFAIQPDSTLPAITDTLLIDGYSQPGASPNSNGIGEGSNAVILIELDGSNAAGDGLRVDADGCVVRGLSITNWAQFMQSDAGIAITGKSCRVEGCFIGTGPAGTQDAENFYGIYVNGEAAMIGGLTPDCRNVVSGNVHQIRLEPAARDTEVYNNFIGTNAAGTASISGGTGVWLWEVPNAIIGSNGRGNVISGCNLGPAVSVRTAAGVLTSDQVAVYNNLIGTDVTGELPVPNGRGIAVSFQGSHAVRIYENTIAYNNFTFLNGDYGVSANNVTLNTHLDMRGNRIFGNEGRDVSLVPDQMPAPTIQSLTLDMFGNPLITVSVTGGPQLANMVMDMYSSSTCDDDGATGHGQYLEHQEIFSLDASGSGTFQFSLGVVVGPKISVKTWSLGPGLGTSEFSNCVTYDNTPMGANVSVDLEDQDNQVKSSVIFDSVISQGFTSVTSSASQPTPPDPGFVLLGDYCDIVTTATYSGSITVYVDYDPTALTGPESDIKLLHFDDSLVPAQWVDVTTFVDEAADRVCGRVASLSPFVAIYPTVSTGIPNEPPQPASLALGQNYPNPFNPTTTIGYEVPVNAGRVELVIFDVDGRRVRTLVDGTPTPGVHSTTWDGRNEQGVRVSSGVYFYRLSAGDQRVTRKLVLLK